MSQKIEVSLVEKLGKQVGVSEELLQALLERIADESTGEEKEKAPSVKKQFVILVSDPQGFLKTNDFCGWVLQIEESEHPLTVVERITKAALDYNASKRGRLQPVQTIGESVENVKSAIFKESGVWVKTREAVLVVRTNNELPVEKLCSGAND